MISIERDAEVFAQQVFDRPLREIACIKCDIKDFVDQFSLKMEQARVPTDSRKVLWLDYDTPKEFVSQLQTLQAVINLASDGDVVRVTLNASAGSLGNYREGETDNDLQSRRLAKLTSRFGDFLPDGLSTEHTKTEQYPAAVLDALKLAVVRATSKSRRSFFPLLIVEYADGQRMLTVTGIILPDSEIKSFLRNTGILRWPYYCQKWTNIEKVSKAPTLTLRERMLVNQRALRSNRLPTKLAYLSKLQGLDASNLMELYRRYQRFFPQFQNVDI
jgi:hypothetical protein